MGRDRASGHRGVTAAARSGVDGEALRQLDITPIPGRPLRTLLPEQVVKADLARIASDQYADGGWTVDHASQTEAAAPEWRGHATVRAVRLLSECTT